MKIKKIKNRKHWIANSIDYQDLKKKEKNHNLKLLIKIKNYLISMKKIWMLMN